MTKPIAIISVGNRPIQSGMCSMSSSTVLLLAKASEAPKKPSTPWPAKISLNGRPAMIEPKASTPSGISITIGLSCASFQCLRSCGSPWKVLKISRQE